MHLFQSNRLENLFDALCATLTEPISNPLAPEVIVVQNPGMARWLSQQIALRTGISAHFSFPLPASFIWNLFEQTLQGLPDLSRFDRNVLLWRVQNELEALLAQPGMEEINAYLAEDTDGRKRFQLAEKISDLFDQYQVYRPSMLLHWEQGGEGHWQARLWRRLIAENRMHRAALLQRFLQAAELGELGTDGLPERVSVFGINSLAPAYLEVIERVSEFVDIRIFHLSPCQQAWDDILSERLLALKRQSWRDQGVDDLSDYFTAGNPLLASMGTVGQEFFSLLMGSAPQEIQLYQEPEGDSLLQQIQSDILNLHDRGGLNQSKGALLPDDASIRFHCCHSPLREIQVLHDRLLDLFASDPSLKPADILITAPDITAYAPAVAGVFGSAPPARHIPWSIADQACRQEQPVIEGFLNLLELQESRFTAPNVMALLENQTILRRFGLAAEDVVLMRSSILEAGIRWGLDQEQRCEQGLADAQQHTWDFGLDRLLLGYLTGSLDEPWQGIMPCSGTVSSMGSWLGGLADFIRSLQKLRRKMKTRHLPDQWAELLGCLLDDFLVGEGDNQDGVLILRRTIADFVEHCRLAGFEQKLSLPIIRHWFETRLSEPAGTQSFLAGRVTFCNMVPMRSVPFKVIWLLGMNDLDYPRTQRSPAFDLMSQQPRLGDRSRRDDDRYLFLEALLSARAHLAISWVGRDQQDNSSLPPSVVAAELRDYINRGWSVEKKPSCEGEKERAAAEMLTVEYPLQPFSRHCFSGDPKTASYASEWLPKPLPFPACYAFLQGPLPQPEPCQQVDLSRLVRFWNHPVRFFLEQRMGLRSRYAEEVLPEAEAFFLDHLQKYLLSQEIISTQRAEGENIQHAASPLYRMQAAGHLPGGRFGHILYREMARKTAVLVDALEPITQERADPEEVILRVDDIVLTGQLTSLYRSGRVTFRPASLKAGDVLKLWIHHLVLLIQSPAVVQPVSVHAALDTTVCFQEVERPEEELTKLVRFFQQGEAEPLHFYPKTSYAWAKAKSEGAAWNAARRTWYSGFYGGECDDPAYEIALRAQEPLGLRFAELAELFWPVVASMKKYEGKQE
ncbi:DNA helicase/exodeoxyribonuclease V, gamma subunit [Candidatus Electrothrix aarhusensis]|uniref:DNA helicase/exodeoxyribonuclease V, gamma subunit n=1 Tax=Candidatus Electrothrix aarhusensis TaxID=1859131 RepID=A0A3S3U768_9BACT|nr:DNA helicase/exodeoxyribonuclease V, gamma subunit [Candidatus Electrothrix aarhusensis]